MNAEILFQHYFYGLDIFFQIIFKMIKKLFYVEHYERLKLLKHILWMDLKYRYVRLDDAKRRQTHIQGVSTLVYLFTNGFAALHCK